MGLLFRTLAELHLNDDETARALRYLGEKNIDALISDFGADRTVKLTELMSISCCITEAVPKLRSVFNGIEVQQIEALSHILENEGLAKNVQLDFSIVSDRNYYNDFVFRGYLEGLPSAVLAGGQYDHLMEKMNKQAKGIGFAVYLDQLEFLEHRTADHDIDTVLLYDESADLAALSAAASSLSDDGVFLAKRPPAGVKYRKLMQFKDGRLITIEENC